MKNIISLLLVITLVFGVFANLNIPAFATEVVETTEIEATEPEATEPETTEPETTEPETTEPETTEPETTEPETTEPETTEPETTEKEVVLKPSNIKLSQNAKGVKITWSAVKNAVSYKVYRKTASGSWKSIAKNVTTCSYTDEKSKAGITYFYAVEACSADATSGYNKTGVSIVRLLTPDVNGIENAVGGIKVKWKTVKGAKTYQVLRKVSNGSWKAIGTTTKNYFTDKNVSNGKTYKYTVKAVNGNSKSGYESGMSLKYVAVPKISSVKNLADGLKITWKAVKGSTSYKVYRLATGEKEWKLVGTVKTTTYTDKKVIAHQSYKYSVRAVNGKMSALDTKGTSKKFVPTGKWSKQVTYNFYKNAIDKAVDSEPRYTLKNWQKVDSSKATGKNKALVNEFNSIMKSSFYPASDPFVYKCKKGSEESELLLPSCNAKLGNIKSATASKSGNYIVVKIVMKDETSPEKNKGGIKAMSGNYYDLNSIVKEFKNQGLITSGSSSSTYKNFTITAKIKPNGEIVSMNHSCQNIKMSMNMNFVSGLGNIKYNAQIDSYLTYTNFKY